MSVVAFPTAKHARNSEGNPRFFKKSPYFTFYSNSLHCEINLLSADDDLRAHVSKSKIS